MLRVNPLRYHWAWSHLGPVSVLRPLHMRDRRGRAGRPAARARRGLRPHAQAQPQVQALREDQQDGSLPRLLSDLRMRSRRHFGVPRNRARSPRRPKKLRPKRSPRLERPATRWRPRPTRGASKRLWRASSRERSECSDMSSFTRALRGSSLCCVWTEHARELECEWEL